MDNTQLSDLCYSILFRFCVTPICLVYLYYDFCHVAYNWNFIFVLSTKYSKEVLMQYIEILG